jgi:uncharacterized membrane protein
MNGPDDKQDGARGWPAEVPLPPPRPHSARTRLRTYFLTGVIVAGPLAITIYLTWWFISLIDGWVKPLIPANLLPDNYLPFAIPGFGLLVAFFGLTLLGFLAANLAGRTMLSAGENLLDRMPVVRGIYKSVKQVFETIFSQSGTSFRKMGLVEYPTRGMWSIVFISAAPTGELAHKLPEKDDYVGVFLPCAPNPTTGFFFFLPRRDVIELDMPVDDGAKIVMSAGLIQPDEQMRRLIAAKVDEREAGKAA